MPVLIAMLRGVNVVGRNKIKMDALRALFVSMGFEDPRTYLQSGNVIFRTKAKSSAALTMKIKSAVERKFGFAPEIILRTPAEFRAALAADPFAGRNLHPSKVLVTFLASDPGPTAQFVLETFKKHPEELHLKGRELYIYFPNGAGQTKLPWSQIEKHFKVTGTARNWTSVTKILAIAEELEVTR